MAKRDAAIRWLDEPENHDDEAARSYLTLARDDAGARRFEDALIPRKIT